MGSHMDPRHAKRMSRYIRDMMRTGSTIRLDHEKWKEVDRNSINRLLGQINDRFHFDVPKMEPWLIAKMNSIWVRVKCNIKKKHFSPGATVHAQYSKCPVNFPPHQWKALVDYWRTSKAEKMSAQANANRKNGESGSSSRDRLICNEACQNDNGQ